MNDRDRWWTIGSSGDRYATVYGSHWGIRVDPDPSHHSGFGGVLFTTLDAALAYFASLKPGTAWRESGHVYEVVPADDYDGQFVVVAGPLECPQASEAQP